MKRTLTILTMAGSMLAASAMAQGVGDAARKAQQAATVVPAQPAMAEHMPVPVPTKAEPVWPQEPQTYRGVAWGAPISIDELRDVIENNRASYPSPIKQYPNLKPVVTYPSPAMMTVKAMIGDIEITETWSEAPEQGGLETVLWQFDSSDFDALGATLVLKFGSPIEARDYPIKNRMGAEFTNSVWVWVGPTVFARFTRYAGNVTKGVAVIGLRAADQRVIDEDAAQAAAAKDSF